MRKSKAGLFLMELLISLLFFAFAGAICLQLFVGAHVANQSSSKISSLSLLLNNYSESFYDSSYTPKPSDIIYYNSALNLCEASDANYTVITYTDVVDNYLLEHISITDSESGESLLEYDLKKYVRRTKDATQE